MKFIQLVIAICFNLTGFSQGAEFYFDRDYHYYVDGVDVSDEVSGQIVENDIVFVHNAIIYNLANYQNCTNANQKCSATEIGNYSKGFNNGWPLEFYVKKGDYVLTYLDGGFIEVDEYIEGADTQLYALINGHYIRYSNYNETPDNKVEDILIHSDGLWWQDANNNLYILRHGKDFEGQITTTFKKGYIAFDSNTNEFLLLDFVTAELEANTMNFIEVVPNAFEVNITPTKSYAVYQPFYGGKELSDNYSQAELDDNQVRFHIDPDINKAFISSTDGGRDLIEIAIPESKHNAYWLLAKNREVVLITDGEIWGTYDHYNHYNGEWALPDYPGYRDAEPYTLYPATKAK